MAEIIELSNNAINFDNFQVPPIPESKPTTKAKRSSRKAPVVVPVEDISTDIADEILDEQLEMEAMPEQLPTKPVKKDKVKTISMVEDDVKQHTEVIVKINRYLTEPSYEQYLKKLGFKLNQDKMLKMTTEELNTYCDRLRTAVSNKSSVSFIKGTVHVGIKMIEGISQNPRIKPHFDLEGWYTSLAQNEELEDCLTQLEIENGVITMLPPHQRLLYILAKSAAMTLGTNKMKKTIENRQNAQPVAPVEVVNQVPPNKGDSPIFQS
jgi:hypothetical protein